MCSIKGIEVKCISHLTSGLLYLMRRDGPTNRRPKFKSQVIICVMPEKFI